MNEYINIGSITVAMRAKEVLRKEGITAYINRNTNLSAGSGCGYSLSVSYGQKMRAVSILQQYGIRVRESG